MRGDEGFERGALEKKYLPAERSFRFDLFVNSAFFDFGKKSKKPDNKGIEGSENVLKNKGICTCYCLNAVLLYWQGKTIVTAQTSHNGECGRTVRATQHKPPTLRTATAVER